MARPVILPRKLTPNPLIVIEPLEQRIAPANLAFSVGIGGSQNETIQHVGVDAAGNTYVIGTFHGTVDFDPSSGVANRTAATGRTDAFVAKYTDAGALVWVDVIRDSNEDASPNLQLAVANNGDVFIANDFGKVANSSIDFFEGTNSFSSSGLNQIGSPTDIYVAKLDPTAGHVVWTNVYGTTNPVGLGFSSIVTDNNGGVYVAGTMQSGSAGGQVSFGPFTLISSTNESNLFVFKVDGGSQTVAWAAGTSSGGTGSNGINQVSLAVDKIGNVAIAGNFSGTVNFGTTASPSLLAASDPQDIYVTKLDASGNLVWARHVTGGGTDDGAEGVAFNSTGDVYVSGRFSGTADFNPSQPGLDVAVSAGGRDAFLLKIDTIGNFGFLRTIGATGTDEGGPIAIDGSDHIHMAGSFGGTVSFDGTSSALPEPGQHNLTSVGPEDLFLLTTDSTGAFLDVARIDATRTPSTSSGFVLGSSNSGGGDIAVDAFGGVHFAGTFSKSINLNTTGSGSGLTSHGGTDVFIARYLPDGGVAQTLEAPIFNKGFSLGSAGTEYAKQVLTDAAGNIYVAGVFTGTLDFDPGVGVTNLTSTDPDGNIFVAKYTSSGSLAWARSVQMGLTIDAFVPEVDVHLGLDNAGNVYLSGDYEVSATFSSGGATADIVLTNSDGSQGNQHRDVFITKLDSAGTFQWAGSIGSSGQSESIQSMAIDPGTGAVNLGGNFKGTVDFDPGAGQANLSASNGFGLGDGFLVQLDTNGSFNWAHRYGGLGAVVFAGLTVDHSGDLIATGDFQGSIPFNSDGSSDVLTANTDDLFIAKFTGATGQVVWKNGYASSFGDLNAGKGVAVDSQNNIFVTGLFSDVTNFGTAVNPILLVQAGGDGTADVQLQPDAFLAKLDSNGNVLKAVGFGGAGDDHASAVFVDGKDSVSIAGIFSGTVNFDTNGGMAKLTSNGALDGFIARFNNNLGFNSASQINGYDNEFGSAETSGPGLDLNHSGVFVDSKDNTFIAGGFSGTFDADPGATKTQFVSQGSTDVVVFKLAPENTLDATHPRTFVDANGDVVTLKLTGPGSGTFSLGGGVGNLADLSELDLTGTSLTSALSVTVAKANSGDGATIVGKVLTTDFEEHMGSISFGKTVALGDGVADTIPDLLVSGKLNSLTLGDIAPNTLIKLGRDLPYNILADTTTPDTYNNHPTVSLGNVLGAGVSLEVLGDGTPQGVGGGGLGDITISSWSFPGFIKTTQSIGKLTALNGNFLATLEIDKFSVGALTTANAGAMTVLNGNWGSSGNVIEGSIASFTVGGFLAGAEIQAASVGKITVSASSSNGTGSFDGTLTLTDTDAASSAVGAFLVQDNFTGGVITSKSLKNLIILGTFTGSLQAASIGTITAFAFDGTTTGDTLYGDANRSDIIATAGSIGSIKALSGTIKNYEIKAALGVGDMTVSLSKLTADTIGIDNVSVQAKSIGKLNVTLKAATSAPGLDLTGINNCHFTTTSSTAGNVGDITVSITGGTGQTSGTGIRDTIIDADVVQNEFGSNDASTVNKVGNLSVKLTNQGGTATGMDCFTVTADKIGNVTVAIAGTNALASSSGITDGSSFTANGPTATGTSAATLGAISSTITGGTGLEQGAAIASSQFNSTASAIGNIAAVISTKSINLDIGNGLDAIRDSNFSAGTLLGSITATAKAASTSTADNAGVLAGLHASAADMAITAPGGIGKITVSATGAPDDNIAVRTDGGHRVAFTASSGDIASTHFTASKGKALGSAAHALSGVDFLAGGRMGTFTVDGDATATQVTDLQLSAGGVVGSVSIGATVKQFGSMIDSNILAGQSLVINAATVALQNKQLANGALGAVTISGSLTNSKLVSASNVGSVSVTGDMQNSLILAGAALGGDGMINGNESYIQQGTISSVKVAGQFTRSSIVAGMNPGADYVFGSSDDTAASNASLLTAASHIGALVFGATTTTTSSGVLAAAPIDHNFAIEAGGLGSLHIGTLPLVKDFTTQSFIDATGDGEDANDVLVRLKS